MPPETMTTILSLVAIASAAVSTFVSLYVRSAIAPIVARQQEQENRINDRRQDCVDLWREVRKVGEEVAELRGRFSSKGE